MVKVIGRSDYKPGFAITAHNAQGQTMKKVAFCRLLRNGTAVCDGFTEYLDAGLVYPA